MVPSINDKNIKGLVGAINIKISSHRNSELVRLILRTPDVFNVLFSVPLSGLRINNFILKSNNVVPDNTFDELLAVILHYADIGDSTNAKRVLKEVPTLYQQAIQILFTSKLKSKLSDMLLLETMSTLYSRNDLIKLLPAPLANTVSTSILQSMDKNIGEVDYPLMLVSLNKKFDKETLFYLKRRGSVVTSNSTFKDAKRKVLQCLPAADMGCIFVTHKITGKGKYHSRGVKILFQGDAKQVAQVFRGTPTDIMELEFPDKNSVVLNNDDELTELITNSRANYTNYLVSDKGIVKVKYKEYIKVAYVTDFWLDDNFEPIGLLVNYEGTSYPIKVNSRYLEDVDITNLSVKVRVKYYKDNVISVTFIRFRKD